MICDNQGVVNNIIFPQYTLGYKQNALNYNVVREADAAEILRVGKEYTETNLDGLLTKILGWQRRRKLPPFVLYSVLL